VANLLSKSRCQNPARVGSNYLEFVPGSTPNLLPSGAREDIGSSSWSKSGVSFVSNPLPNAPDGSKTADRLYETAIVGVHRISITPQLAIVYNQPHTFSFFVRDFTGFELWVAMDNVQGSQVKWYVDLNVPEVTHEQTTGSVGLCSIH